MSSLDECWEKLYEVDRIIICYFPKADRKQIKMDPLVILVETNQY